MSEQIKNQTNINSVQGDVIFNQNTSVDAKNYYYQEVHMINKGTGTQINGIPWGCSDKCLSCASTTQSVIIQIT